MQKVSAFYTGSKYVSVVMFKEKSLQEVYIYTFTQVYTCSTYEISCPRKFYKTYEIILSCYRQVTVSQLAKMLSTIVLYFLTLFGVCSHTQAHMYTFSKAHWYTAVDVIHHVTTFLFPSSLSASLLHFIVLLCCMYPHLQLNMIILLHCLLPFTYFTTFQVP